MDEAANGAISSTRGACFHDFRCPARQIGTPGSGCVNGSLSPAIFPTLDLLYHPPHPSIQRGEPSSVFNQFHERHPAPRPMVISNFLVHLSTVADYCQI